MFKVILRLHNEFKTGRGSQRLRLEKKMKERKTHTEWIKKEDLLVLLFTKNACYQQKHTRNENEKIETIF